MWMPWDILQLQAWGLLHKAGVKMASGAHWRRSPSRVITYCIFTTLTATACWADCLCGLHNEYKRRPNAFPCRPSSSLRRKNYTSWLKTIAAHTALILHVGCVTLRKKKTFCIVSARLTFRVFTFQSALRRRVWTPWCEQVQHGSALTQTFAKITPKWQINTSCFYRCKINRSNADPSRGCEAGLHRVWRTPLHHLLLQTLCNLNLFVAFMLYWPPKVKERDLDLKHKSSLQALELSLPLNAPDQCPFLLKIKPFWTLKAFHCWAMSKCHTGKWAEKSPFFP